MNNFDREFEEEKDRMYWVIAILVIIAIVAFISWLFSPLIKKIMIEFISSQLSNLANA